MNRFLLVILAGVLAAFASCAKSGDEEGSKIVSIVDNNLVKEIPSGEQPSILIPIAFTGSYTVDIDCGSGVRWLKEATPATRAVSRTELKLSAEANTTNRPREATVTLTAKDLTQKFKVVQLAPSGAIRVDVGDPEFLPAPGREGEDEILTFRGVSNDGETIPLVVTPHVPYKVWIDDSTPWARVQSSPDSWNVMINIQTTYNLQADSYEYSNQRVAVVHFETETEGAVSKTSVVIQQNPRIAGVYNLTDERFPNDPEPTDAASSRLGRSLVGETPGYRYGASTIKIIGPMTQYDWDALKFNGNTSDWVVDPDKLNNIVPQMRTLDLSEAEITEIPDGAFGTTGAITNANLLKIILPEGLKRIGDLAFQYCTNLEDVNIPPTIEYIGNRAFYHSSIRPAFKPSLVFPRTIKYIGDEAFAGFRLTALSFEDPDEEYCINPDGTTSTERLKIGNGAFKTDLAPSTTGQAGRLTGDLQIPNWVDSIGYHSFAALYYLKPDAPQSGNTVADESTANATIKIGRNVTFIGYGAFQANLGVTAFDFAESTAPLAISSQSSTTGYGIFARTGITEFEWPISSRSNTIVVNDSGTPETNGDALVPNFAFYGCRNLTKVTIGYGVTNIGIGVFSGSALSASLRTGRSNLEELTLPTSLVEIGKTAFASCGGVKFVHIIDDQGVVTESTTPGLWDLRKTKLKIIREQGLYNIASANTYIAPGQRMEEIRFPSTIREFEAHAINTNPGLASDIIYLPDGFGHSTLNGAPTTSGEYIIRNTNFCAVTPAPVWTYVPESDWGDIVYP